MPSIGKFFLQLLRKQYGIFVPHLNIKLANTVMKNSSLFIWFVYIFTLIILTVDEISLNI